MKLRHLTRAIVTSLVLVGFLTVSAACYGPFNLTRNVYHWNSNIKGSGEVNEKWMKEIVFFGMIVIPVYMFSALLDAFVFNSIQFWSGDNPVKLTRDAEGYIHEVHLSDTTISVVWLEDHRLAALTYRQQGQITKTARIVEQGGGFRIVEDGESPVYVGEFSVDGGVNILDRDCRLVDHVSSDRMQQGAKYLALGMS